MFKKSLCLAVSLMSIAGSVAAATQSEAGYSRSQIEAATAAILTRDQLDLHLATNPSSPIYKMSPSLRSAFLASLVFTNRGLGSFSFVDLAGMTVTDAYRVLSLFGSQSAIGGIPGLVDKSELDHSILAQAREDERSAGVALLGNPRENKVCVVQPDGNSGCKDSRGGYCADSCGG